MQLTADLAHAHAHHAALRRINMALSLITTGLAHRDCQIRDAILRKLAGTTAHGELLTKPVELLDAIASTITAIGRRLRDGFAYDTLLELQTEARAIFSRIDGAQ